MENDKLFITCQDYVSNFEAVDELKNTAMKFTNNSVVLWALISEIINRAADMGGCWNEIQSLGFKGNEHDIIDLVYNKKNKFKLQIIKKGDDDEKL